MHFDTEVDQDKETYSSDNGIHQATHGQGVVNAVGKHRNQEHAGSDFREKRSGVHFRTVPLILPN